MADRVTITDKGKLDEIVATKGAHLERTGKHSWFLQFDHADGTSTALWFESKDLVSPTLETREPINQGLALSGRLRERIEQ